MQEDGVASVVALGGQRAALLRAGRVATPVFVPMVSGGEGCGTYCCRLSARAGARPKTTVEGGRVGRGFAAGRVQEGGAASVVALGRQRAVLVRAGLRAAPGFVPMVRGRGGSQIGFGTSLR